MRVSFEIVVVGYTGGGGRQGRTFANHLFNGLGIKCVGSRFVISEPIVFYSVTHLCNTIKPKP